MYKNDVETFDLSSDSNENRFILNTIIGYTLAN